MKVFKGAANTYNVELEEEEQASFAAVVESIGAADHEVMIMVIRRGLLGMMEDVAEGQAHDRDAAAGEGEQAEGEVVAEGGEAGSDEGGAEAGFGSESSG